MALLAEPAFGSGNKWAMAIIATGLIRNKLQEASLTRLLMVGSYDPCGGVTVANSRPAAFLVALALLRTSSGHADAQKHKAFAASVEREALSLDIRDNGQRVAARVGQQIEITLGTIGPGHYGDPQVSSPAIRYENVALAWPPTPGGPTQIYVFEAAAEGEARVEIRHTYLKRVFAVTIRVGLPAGEPPTMMPDQASAAKWTGAWAKPLNKARQTFTPSLPRLTGVEVELVVANPGPPDDEVTLTVKNIGGDTLALISKTVPVADCDVLFVFPNSGLEVSPGRVYSIGLSGGSLFGWKYAVGGYGKGEAWFNGKPVLPGTRSTFLFQTFGAS